MRSDVIVHRIAHRRSGSVRKVSGSLSCIRADENPLTYQFSDRKGGGKGDEIRLASCKQNPDIKPGSPGVPFYSVTLSS